MNKLLVPILMLSLAFAACDREGRTINPDKHTWGALKAFSDFPLKPYVSDTLYKTLRFELNRNAKGAVSNVEFQLVERIVKRNEKTFARDTVYSIPKGVVLLKNGKPCENNILIITPHDESARIGIAFTNAVAKENFTHTFMLKVVNNGGLDRIGNIDVSSAANLYLADEWEVIKQEIWNPLAKILFWVVVVIIAFLVVWRIFIRPRLNDTFAVTTLYIFYPQMQRVGIKGFIKVVCSNKKQSQSFINKFFIGKIAFVQSEFWEQDIEIVPKDKKSVRIRPQRQYTVLPGAMVVKGADTEITNNNTKKITKLKIE